eukprot:m.39738 g.39738  ORF g.39738 m.39738 type:complete len:251 (-) comp12695_c0_seq1:37-789(-)
MELIGAGWGRTGTDSTKAALEMLGFKCQHMKVVMSGPKQTQQFWAQALQEKYGPPCMPPREWEKKAAQMAWNDVGFAGGFDACVDFPFSPFYKEILEANPGAKVLLTVRDDGEKWYKSTYDTIYGFQRNRGIVFWLLSLSSPMMSALSSLWGGLLQGTMEDKEKAVALYEQHIEEVKRCVPAHQLLIFNVKQGWQPLCTFLDKPVPKEPFPHVNSSADMKKIGTFLARAELALRCTIGVAVVALGYILWS